VCECVYAGHNDGDSLAVNSLGLAKD